MLHTFARRIRRYDYAPVAIRLSLAFSLLFIVLMILNGLLW